MAKAMEVRVTKEYAGIQSAEELSEEPIWTCPQQQECLHCLQSGLLAEVVNLKKTQAC